MAIGLIIVGLMIWLLGRAASDNSKDIGGVMSNLGQAQPANIAYWPYAMLGSLAFVIGLATFIGWMGKLKILGRVEKGTK